MFSSACFGWNRTEIVVSYIFFKPRILKTYNDDYGMSHMGQISSKCRGGVDVGLFGLKIPEFWEISGPISFVAGELKASFQLRRRKRQNGNKKTS